MKSANKLSAYRANAVSSATPENLVVMMYDGAIRFLGAAIRAFEHEDPLDFNLNIHENVTKTQAVIRELNHALDLENGGELAHSLSGLYVYFDNRLQEANISKNKEIIEEILQRISDLRDAWSESFQQQAEAAQLAAATPPAASHPAAPGGAAQFNSTAPPPHRISWPFPHGLIMNPSTTILLREWKRLAEQEATAIASREWPELNELLDQKDRIKDLLEDYESPDFTEGDHQLVTEIISITGQNQQQLQLAMTAVQSQIQTEDRSLNTMRKVHQTYGQQGGPSFWHSYS